MLGEGVAHVGAGAVAVVGQRLDQDRRAAGPVALEEDLLDRRRVGARAGPAVDRPLDVVLGHRGVARLLDRRRQGRVALGVAAAVARGDVIARASFVNSLPRLASAAPFLCLIEDHFE